MDQSQSGMKTEEHMQKMDGKALSLTIESKIKENVSEYSSKGYRKPKLVVLLIGDNPASVTYVKNKEKACERVGIESIVYRMDANVTTHDVLKVVNELNSDNTVDGILVQLPIPKQLDVNLIIETLDSNKDVDGLHPVNIAKLYANQDGFVPCTPRGIMTLLNHYNIEISGKHAIVIGRSALVGRPVAQLLLNENATVTVCHSKTKDLAQLTRLADIIVIAIGRDKFLTPDHINHANAIIDVGINRVNDKLVGDVDYEALMDKVDYMTPVPGGVGPMTIVSLLENTLKSYEKSIKEN
ncbi:MAG TPA: bifunctional methylenetetrahydrofolate dehydrogenase/methenyltetrahydrofolate cyclohydrolase FolD [Erysipelotrichaceae bacterium]|nr:bifunctional methylenetetrahydrofolate dehydrogenase/methenyltetrahydrofolate cyclohydrolase FolD [Erysipelotrichaceae bacterium]